MLFTVVLAAVTLALPGASLVVQKPSVAVHKRQPSPQYNIHPNGDTSKCIGVSNGVLAPGSAVTIFDCNGSPSQKWAWWGGYSQSPLFVTNPTNNKRFCMVVPDNNNIENGTKLQLRECRSTDEVTWVDELFTMPDSWDSSMWFAISSSTDPWNLMCVDLTDGSKVNRNVLQLWQCAPYGQPTYQNQIWTLTAL